MVRFFTRQRTINNLSKGEEINRFKEVCDSERSDNIFYLEEPCDPKTWYETTKEFVKSHKDKKQIIITIDHLALVRDLLGNKKKSMDDLVEYINSLKKEFKNVCFLLVSQMNREIESRTDVRYLAPKRSDLYNTDTLFQISDIVIAIHNPYKLGHDKYMVVSPSRYPYLIEHMDKPSNKRTNFETYNKIFWHYLKIREIEDMEDIHDIHIESLSVPNLRDSLEKDKSKPIDDKHQFPLTPDECFKVEQVEQHDVLPDDFLNDNEDNDVPF